MPPILGQPRARESSGRRTRGRRRSHFQVACYSVSRDRAIGSLKPLLWKRRTYQARAYSSAGLERTPDKREVGGSNPPRPTSSDDEASWGCSSVGRAPALQAGCRRFDSDQLHQVMPGTRVPAPRGAVTAAGRSTLTTEYEG
jgi:hypothetical protein